ncbi:MAG: hypothetical protein NVS4B3_08170 [Gemmatimonadaceae bacterium]
MPVIVLIADGARPDVLRAAIDAGTLPALGRLRDEGSLATIATAFPSVTGPAYAPLLTGRYPGPAGLPGLRWFDRSRERCRRYGHARSYAGHEMRHVDGDLDPSTPTLFELAGRPLGALTVITRGLAPAYRIGNSARFALGAAMIHFRGNVKGWLAVDDAVSREVIRRVAEVPFDLVVAALTGVDKASHAEGHGSPRASAALAAVDTLARELRDRLTSTGRWPSTHLWIVSDHGHSPVHSHDDLARGVSEIAGPVLAHPWMFAPRARVAVMVGGNAMAHVYVDIHERSRRWWPSLAPQWEPLAASLLARPAVDLLLLPHSPERCEVRSAERGRGLVYAERGRFTYEPLDGDPLGIGYQRSRDAKDAYDAARDSDYPDAIVQIVRLAGSSRAGDIIVSGALGWDLRSRYEPIPHVSAHGSLRSEHMLVPLLTNRPVRSTPRRTADVFASAVAALGLPVPPGCEGESFIAEDRWE